MLKEKFNPKSRHILLGFTALVGFSLFTFSFILSYIDMSLTSDIIMRDSFICKILPYLKDLITLLGFSLFYAVTVYSFHTFGIKKSWHFLLLISVLTIYKYAYEALGNRLIYQTSKYDFLAYILPSALSSCSLELFQLALIVGLTLLILHHFHRNPTNQDSPLVPPRNIVKLKNPIFCSLFFISLVVMTINIIIRIIYDINYGAPSSSKEVLRMVLAYGSDILFYGVVLYLLMRLFIGIINALHKKHLS